MFYVDNKLIAGLLVKDLNELTDALGGIPADIPESIIYCVLSTFIEYGEDKPLQDPLYLKRN